MTNQEIKRVKAWLYSIPTTEQAILNLELAIEDLNVKLENPPSHIASGVANYSGVMVSGGFSISKQDSYSDWYDENMSRLRFLKDVLEQKKRKAEQYGQTLELLKQEPKWGYMAGEVIRKKYYCKVRPDKAIYTLFLFISAETFYRMHRRGLQYFYDVLPDVFL